MATLQMGNKTLFTQSGSADPVMSNSVQQPSGSVIQVVSKVADDQVEYQDSSSFQEITPLEISITPRFSASKFLVQYTLTLGINIDTAFDGTCHVIPYFKVNSGGSYSEAVRASTAPPLSGQVQSAFFLDIGDDDAARSNSIMFIHSPVYNLNDTIYYAPYLRIGYNITSHIFLNRNADMANNSAWTGYFISTATIMEIAA